MARVPESDASSSDKAVFPLGAPQSDCNLLPAILMRLGGLFQIVYECPQYRLSHCSARNCLPGASNAPTQPVATATATATSRPGI